MFGNLRRVRRWMALAMVVLAAYVGGVVTGVIGSGGRLSSMETSSVIDEAAERIESRADRAVDRDDLERAAVEGMLESLDDRWSAFYEPSEFGSFRESLDGRYSGVGLWIRRAPDGSVEVADVQAGSPAMATGIARGDEVVAIDGRPVAGQGVAETVSLLRGQEGSRVRITYRHGGEGDRENTITLVRTRLSSEDVTVERLPGGVTRISIAAFTRGVGQGVGQAMRGGPADHPRGVILDLRDNPGGLLEEAVEVASVFLDGGPVVTYERRGAGARTLDASPGGDATTPLVVLVGGGTASAAEVVAGALQDRSRAVIVGTRTFGKGTVQEPSRLSDGSGLELTVGRYTTPSGRSIDGVGIEPDVRVEEGAGPALTERRATDVLTGLVAALEPGARG